MSPRPTVAIIGAGPAGLTTAKSILAVGLAPTIFDSKPCVGGLWANAASTTRSMTVERKMRTNLSKYMCSFSDYEYGEVEEEANSDPGMGDGVEPEIGNSANEESPAPTKEGREKWDLFPTAEVVGRYLEGYAKKFLVGKGCELRLNMEVTKIDKVEIASAASNGTDEDRPKSAPRWRVHYRDANRVSANITAQSDSGLDKSQEFDFLVLAFGFNSRAYIPALEGTPSFPGDIMHTSEYSWKRILELHARKSEIERTRTNTSDQPGKLRILIVGGSLSGAETSAEMAIEISSLPEEEREKFELVHVFPRPFWVLPRYLPGPQAPASSSSDGTKKGVHPPHFLPLDLCMSNLRRRTNASAPPMTVTERCRLANGFIKSLVGSDQSGFYPDDSGNSDLTITDEAMEAPPWVSVSDSYQAFVREGRVKTMRGRVTAFGEGGAVRVKRTGGRGEDGGEYTIAGVDCVIFATGYTPAMVLREILPRVVASAITSVPVSPPHEEEQDFTYLPILLYNAVLHPSLARSAGCVGMYKGPFFTGLELQGRWLAGLLAGTLKWPSDEGMNKWIEGEKAQREARFKVEGLARIYRSRADYVEIVLDYCKRLGLTPPDASMNEDILSPSLNISPLLPAHLLSSPTERRASLTRFAREIAQPTRSVSIAVFRALHGRWSVSRTTKSSTPGPTDGMFHGTAIFIPRKATFVPGDSENNQTRSTPNGSGSGNGQLVHIPPEQQNPDSATVYEYLYLEDGELTTNSGEVLSAQRSYIYRLVLSPIPRILTYFVKHDRATADYFFHELELYEETNEDGNGAGTLWKAKGEHLCSDDWYWPEYMFHFKGVELLDYEIGYKVKGPKKDYTTMATYRR